MRIAFANRGRRLLLPFVMALAAAPPQAEAWQIRKWTLADGRSFDAAFVRVEGTNAVFRFENGRTFSTPLEGMGPGEQALLTTLREVSGGEPERPTALNFGAPWPRGVRMDGASQSKVVSEDAKTGRYVYESPNYRFTCDARLTSDVLRNFAMMFETTYKFAGNLPLSMLGGAGGKKLDIALFESMTAYVRAGGPPNSGGCFVPATGVVMVPMSSLGLERTGTGFSLDTNRHNSVLVHELAHQLTPRAYLLDLRSGWFIEGLAEYFAVTPYHWGYFQPDPHGNAVKSYVTAYGEKNRGGRNLGTTLQAPKLRHFLRMEYSEFAGASANFNYGLALLVTHYFFHMEGGGRSARITAYLKGLREGRSGEEALAPLLGGGTYEKLEAEIAEAWRRKGVEIRFGG